MVVFLCLCVWGGGLGWARLRLLTERNGFYLFFLSKNLIPLLLISIMAYLSPQTVVLVFYSNTLQYYTHTLASSFLVANRTFTRQMYFERRRCSGTRVRQTHRNLQNVFRHPAFS